MIFYETEKGFRSRPQILDGPELVFVTNSVSFSLPESFLIVLDPRLVS
jgi:hypothetical protein